MSSFRSRRTIGKIRIVYPRRLYEARGLYITLAIVDKILKRYPQTEFHFVGKGFDEDVEKIKIAMKRWPGRIECYHKDPDDMHQVYKEADIVLIPTLYSEGTSLSCLEACATKNTIIATRIGGLTDIIIDRFNGLLITPDSQSLERAVIECLDNPELSARLAQNALEVSKAFSKDGWKERWKQLIKDSMKENGKPLNRVSKITSTETIEFRIGPLTTREQWLPEAVKCLKQGMAVFVRGDKEMEPELSFLRMQWISEQTELYFQPTIRQFD